MKVCSYCGETKELEQFRPYYGGRKGRYTYCRSCEAIEMRRKYLNRKGDLSEAEKDELTSIDKLYDIRRQAGLQVPGYTKPKIGVLDQVNQEIARLTNNKDLA